METGLVQVASVAVVVVVVVGNGGISWGASEFLIIGYWFRDFMGFGDGGVDDNVAVCVS